MPIVSTRIDDRLIHGQVASSWLGFVGAPQIICVSDNAAANPVQGQVLKMAAPGYTVHLFSVDKFIDVFSKNPIKKDTFLLTDSTYSVLRMVESGVPIKEVNFGGMRKRAERTIQYEPYLHFTEEEFAAIDKLFAMGVQVNYQVAAYDSPKDIRKYIAELKGNG
ncbi:hypothetical protein A4S06_09875 [Erysipelotrichaceae bacterium MTC7]|nr:hypothetical protein A4S06_09875 [Erysipelotrichaceae bacterium MTC7]